MIGEALLWLDVETTGLDPERDQLLEVAARATHLDPELTTIGEAFQVTFKTLVVEGVAEEVLAMHRESGLWEAVKWSQLDLREGKRRFNAALKGWGLLDGATVYLAGRSVHFDRAWLPRLNSYWTSQLKLSHRHFDLTSIKAFATIAGIEFSVPEDAHRALADIDADIALARELIQAVRR